MHVCTSVNCLTYGQSDAREGHLPPGDGMVLGFSSEITFGTFRPHEALPMPPRFDKWCRVAGGQSPITRSMTDICYTIRKQIRCRDIQRLGQMPQHTQRWCDFAMFQIRDVLFGASHAVAQVLL